MACAWLTSAGHCFVCASATGANVATTAALMTAAKNLFIGLPIPLRLV
jgi:hypothetical protein